MSAGTLTLTNKSAAVSGSGTAFTTELAAGDFAVVTVGGIPYSLPVKSVESNTSLTLVSNFTGPSQAGAAWYAVPRVAMNLVTASLVTQSAEALRGINYDKQNWQQVYSSDGSITVKLPDGTAFTGPSWKYIADTMNTVDGKTGGRISGITSIEALRLPSNSGDGSSISLVCGPFNSFSVLNIEPVNTTNRTVLFPDGYLSRSGTAGNAGLSAFNYCWTNSGMEVWVDVTNVGYINLNPASDAALKKDIDYVIPSDEDALNEVLSWRIARFKYKARGAIQESGEQFGFIANDLITISPACVKGEGLEEGYDENNPAGAYYLDPIAMIAKLTLSIQELQKQIAELQDRRV